MTNSPNRDLDMADVNADAQRMMQEEIESLSEDMEGADLYTVISIIADANGDFLPECLDSRLYRDLIECTQSNPSKSHAALVRIAELDNAIGEL